MLLEVNQILDRLIIKLSWYVLKQLFFLVSLKVVDIYLSTSIDIHFVK